jgi:putative two-component system response regulator
MKMLSDRLVAQQGEKTDRAAVSVVPVSRPPRRTTRPLGRKSRQPDPAGPDALASLSRTGRPMAELPARNGKSVLVVDDASENLHMLVRILTAQGYKPRAVKSGRLALQSAEIDPPDLILLDIMMPQMDGHEVCRRLKANQRLKDIPVIFLSALDDADDKVKAFASGCVDYVTKPFRVEEVQARVDAQMKVRQLQMALEEHNRRLEDLVRDQVKEITASQMATIFALAKLAEARDDDTGQHLERVQTWCKLLAAQCAEQPAHRDEVDRVFVENIVHASPLHDIGKVGIPDAVLLKPGKLSPEEFAEMKKHATLGAETLKAVRDKYPNNAVIRMGIDIARWHHEKWDGKGYPDGLSGTRIPLSARIMALADVYDALRANRCYRPAMSHEKSRAIILEGRGTHFDPDVVDAFLALEATFERLSEAAQG